jgi:hypothetical protein
MSNRPGMVEGDTESKAFLRSACVKVERHFFLGGGLGAVLAQGSR